MLWWIYQCLVTDDGRLWSVWPPRCLCCGRLLISKLGQEEFQICWRKFVSACTLSWLCYFSCAFFTVNFSDVWKPRNCNRWTVWTFSSYVADILYLPRASVASYSLDLLLTYVLYSRGGLGRRASTKERQGIRVIRLRAICLISYQDFRFPAISHLTPPHTPLMQPLRAHGIYLAPWLKIITYWRKDVKITEKIGCGAFPPSCSLPNSDINLFRYYTNF